MMLRRRIGTSRCMKKAIYLMLFLSILTVYYILAFPHFKHFLTSCISIIVTKTKHQTHSSQCPSVLKDMLYGQWLTRNITHQEMQYIELFLESARSQYHIPYTMNRPDGRCGNVRFEVIDETSEEEILFRALCNPKGDNPCCMDGKCVPVTENKCSCRNCFDLRQRIHAEYSHWKPADRRCRPRNFTSEQACSMLEESSFIFLGDSALRHFYMALVVLLKGDPLYGALNNYAEQDIRYRCPGPYMFSQRQCRYWMDTEISLCGGRVNLTYVRVNRLGLADEIIDTRKAFAKTKKSMIIAGIGLYDNFNLHRVFTYALKPMEKHLKKSKQKWPKIIWAAAHAPGLLKTPSNENHQYKNILEYNTAVNLFLKGLKIPVFDTFNLTDGVVSFDGSHYGYGLNMMKARLFMNYIQELKQTQKW